MDHAQPGGGCRYGQLWPPLHLPGWIERAPTYCRTAEAAGFRLQRFAPLNSWPDHVSLTKPAIAVADQQKYGKKILWPTDDPAGNVAMESMGFKDLRFPRRAPGHLGAGRRYLWGPESKWPETSV